jgi:hypothetical protein
MKDTVERPAVISTERKRGRLKAALVVGAAPHIRKVDQNKYSNRDQHRAFAREVVRQRLPWAHLKEKAIPHVHAHCRERNNGAKRNQQNREINEPGKQPDREASVVPWDCLTGGGRFSVVCITVRSYVGCIVSAD